MDYIAALVLIVVLVVSVWALRVAPGSKAADQFIAIWNTRPWGRQFYVDFFGLEVILALWMINDALANGHMTTAIICIVAMPVLGATSAAAYWLLR